MHDSEQRGLVYFVRDIFDMRDSGGYEIPLFDFPKGDRLLTSWSPLALLLRGDDLRSSDPSLLSRITYSSRLSH